MYDDMKKLQKKLESIKFKKKDVDDMERLFKWCKVGMDIVALKTNLKTELEFVGYSSLTYSSDSGVPTFQGTGMAKDYIGEQQCKSLIQAILLKTQISAPIVQMDCDSNFISAIFCYVKAALEMKYTVSAFHEFDDDFDDDYDNDLIEVKGVGEENTGKFFFKQKTAYEVCACLVGSEMCIRDRI